MVKDLSVTFARELYVPSQHLKIEVVAGDSFRKRKGMKHSGLIKTGLKRFARPEGAQSMTDIIDRRNLPASGPTPGLTYTPEGHESNEVGMRDSFLICIKVYSQGIRGS